MTTFFHLLKPYSAQVKRYAGDGVCHPGTPTRCWGCGRSFHIHTTVLLYLPYPDAHATNSKSLHTAPCDLGLSST